jgi:ABC-type dipeptide/oligopeptide/nickel transport system ATPase component
MLQRAMIAAAIVTRPKLLIADEITTALDVTIQAQILDLLIDLNRESGMAILFISHDLHVVRRLCEDVIVMQKGKIVENGRTRDVFAHPEHSYTRHLIEAIPSRDKRLNEDE